MQATQEKALPVRKEVDLKASSAPQLELRLRWFGHALEARRGYIVRCERRRHGREHVASVAYEMPLPAFARRGGRPASPSELEPGL